MKLLPASNIICATLLTGVYDVNRNEAIRADNFETIRLWYQSIMALKLQAIVFHNNFSEETVRCYQNKNIQFIQVDFDKNYNANIYRYIIYNKFLEENKANIANVFFTDITDVVVTKNPFEAELFLQNNGALFCGDENKFLDNPWMNDHSTHLRNNIENFAIYESEHKESTLLNCGIIGGDISTVLLLMNKLATLHQIYGATNNTAYTLDMGVFNFVARTNFAEKIIHGMPVNTVFKNYEMDRKDCWFRHK